LGITELARRVGAAARRELRGGNCAAAIARRDLRGTQLRGAVELESGAELKSGARRGGGEQALVIPGIAISVDVDIHLCVIHGAHVFDAATIILMTFAFLLVFVFAVVGVLLWLFPGVAFAFF
jgi:hypothetical protein